MMQENKEAPNLFTETIYMLQFYYKHTQYTTDGAQRNFYLFWL